MRCSSVVTESLCFNPRGGTLGISGWGCATGTLEPLTYTRASSADSPNPPYPRVAVSLV